MGRHRRRAAVARRPLERGPAVEDALDRRRDHDRSLDDHRCADDFKRDRSVHHRQGSCLLRAQAKVAERRSLSRGVPPRPRSRRRSLSLSGIAVSKSKGGLATASGVLSAIRVGSLVFAVWAMDAKPT